MKKIGILGIIFCMILVAFNFYTSRQTTAQTAETGEFLLKAFAATEADPEGYSIRNWSVLSNEYNTVDELKATAQQLNKKLGITGGKETVEQRGDQNGYTLRGTWKNGAAVQLTLNSLKFSDQAPQTVLVIRVDRDTKDLSDYSAAIRQVREAAAETNAVPQISTCIKGFRADKMENGDTNALVETVFGKVKAKEIEGVRSELVTSVSGYSPLTKDYIVTNGDKMNLQVAVHYDKAQDKTRVLVGSPIVTIEY